MGVLCNDTFFKESTIIQAIILSSNNMLAVNLDIALFKMLCISWLSVSSSAFAIPCK